MTDAEKAWIVASRKRNDTGGDNDPGLDQSTPRTDVSAPSVQTDSILEHAPPRLIDDTLEQEPTSAETSNRLCDICYDLPASVQLVCDHGLCKDCLERAVLLATKDQSMYPPRCCGIIPLELFQDVLSKDLVELFKLRKAEYITADRIYCPWDHCGSFIPADNIRGTTAICPQCKLWWCTTCSGHPHSGFCNVDRLGASAKKALRDARRENWRPCYSCHRLIERRDGCNHIM